MNSIVRKVLFVLAVIFLLYTAAVYSFMKLEVIPSFTQLQDSATGQEVMRCRLILMKEMATVSAICADWSAWDDACQFVDDRNEAFIKSALDPAGLQNTHINTAIFMDTSGKVVWSKSYDWNHEGREMELPEFSPERMAASPFFYSHETVSSERTGLMLLGYDRMAIVSCRPIVSSRKELPIRGALLLARFVTEDDIESLAESLGTRFTLRPAEKVDVKPEPGRPYAIERCCRDHVMATTMMDDVFGNSKLAIVADIPTPIITRGIWVNRYISASVLCAGLVTLFITFVLLKRMILRRLDELSNVLNKVMAKDTQGQAGQPDSDELGRHMDMVMHMLHRLDSAETELGASNERFRAAFFSAPFPMAIHDDTGKLIQLNSQWTEATGYTMEDIPTSVEWCNKAFGPRKDSAIERLHALYKSEDRYTSSDVIVQCKNGSFLTWNFFSSVISKSPNGVRQFITMAIDITERDKALRRLRENESLFRSLTESMPAVTYLAEITPQARLVYVSPQTMTFFGFRPAEMKAMEDPWRMVIAHDHYGKVMNERFVGISSTNQQFTCQYPAMGRSGETMWLREEAIIVNTEKGPVIQGVLFDVTETMQHRDHPAGLQV
jgi:PAS domain S-box-containing protein